MDGTIGERIHAVNERRRSVALAVMPALIAGACATDNGVDGPTRISDLPRLVAEEQLRLGSVDDPDAGFSQIAGAAVDDNGLVYVLDRQERSIRVYDPEGTFLRTIGRDGEGPGEFRRPFGLGVHGDTVWVNDLSLGRLTLFHSSGELVRTFNPQPASLEPLPGVQVMLRPGTLNRDGTITSGWSVAVPVNAPADTFLIPIVRFDTAGVIVDTIRLQPWAFPQRKPIAVGGRPVYPPATPGSEPLYFDSDDATFTVTRPVASSGGQGTFEVTRLSFVGDTLFHRTFRYEPSGYSSTLVDTLIARSAGFYIGQGIDADAVTAAMRAALELPVYQPPVSQGKLGQDNTLWLHREDDAGPDARWLVIGPDGTARGVVDLPRRATIQWASGDVVWASLPDSLDVPWLVKYRLVPPQ